MAKLVWNSPDGALREFALNGGINTIGRLDDNSIHIPDASVSSRHGEVAVESDQLIVRDYGSTNGTFVDDQQIDEAPLRVGQTLRVGNVQFRVLADHESAAKPPSIALPKVALKVRTQEPEVAEASPTAPPPDAPPMAVPRGRVAPPPQPQPEAFSGDFFSLVGGAFAYPAQRSGMFLIISGAVFFAFLDTAQKFFPFGVVWLMVSAISGGYLFSFMQHVITITINGDREELGWPDLTSVADDIIYPFIRLVLTWIVYLAPGFFVMGYFQNPVLGIAVIGLGLLCIPMALLTVALADGVAGLNPIIVFSGIAKAPGQYIVTLIIFALVLGTSGAIEWAASKTGIILLPTLISSLVGLYGLTVEMRVLGLLYRCNAKEFNWF